MIRSRTREPRPNLSNIGTKNDSTGSNGNGEEVQHRPTLPKHAKEERRDNNDRTNHCIRYLTALLICSAFIFLNEPSQSDHSNYGVIQHNLDNFQSASADRNKGRPAAAKLSSFTVDILSVGSINQLELLQSQKRAITAHLSVRNFFNVTEADDADPHCHKNITWEHVSEVANFCRSRKGKTLNRLITYFTGQYARTQWLAKKKNPPGWMCAQPRPYAGLMKAYTHYERTGEPLPNYFIIMDDDTFYNMELFQENFEKLDSSDETFTAGCLVRAPVHQINFTFPFGGFGSILSEGALSNLFRGMACPGWINNARAAEDSAQCNVLKKDNIGELQYFRNGMNIVELMYKYTTSEKYKDVDRWKTGFCMHSDWVIGYFANFYNVSKHVVDPFFRNVPHARIEAYKRSEIYKVGTGFCKNDQTCKEGSEICHRVSPEWLAKETLLWKAKMPDKFH